MNDLMDNEVLKASRDFWGALALPALKRMSIRRPYAKHGRPKMATRQTARKFTGGRPQTNHLAPTSNDPVLPNILAFFGCHSSLEEIVILPPSHPLRLTWHRFFYYLGGRAYPQPEASTGSMVPVPRSPVPLPALCLLWFQIEADELAKESNHALAKALRCALRRRRDLCINLYITLRPNHTIRTRVEFTVDLKEELDDLQRELRAEDGQLRVLDSFDELQWPDGSRGVDHFAYGGSSDDDDDLLQYGEL
ncbi:hypothetical protein DL93DRAFT_2100563 [Clavulina sp. PMI_390]|nr:hypothetical protein DL93DRAFT_2100563 [Clavulina sp. PMI_390]